MFFGGFCASCIRSSNRFANGVLLPVLMFCWWCCAVFAVPIAVVVVVVVIAAFSLVLYVPVIP